MLPVYYQDPTFSQTPPSIHRLRNHLTWLIPSNCGVPVTFRVRDTEDCMLTEIRRPRKRIISAEQRVQREKLLEWIERWEEEG